MKSTVSTLRSLILALAFLLGCIHTAAAVDSTSPQINKDETPFVRMVGGQYMIKASINGQGPFDMLIDSAATRTSLFSETLSKLELSEPPASTRYINGLTGSDMRPVIDVEEISFAGRAFKDHEVVILASWPDDAEQVDGIVGMDILKDFKFSVFNDSGTVRVEKSRRKNRKKTQKNYKGWTILDLGPSPYPLQDYGLLFSETKMGNLTIPTLMDTGSSFSALNWKSLRGTKMDQYRRELRTKWIIRGSVGQFEPKMRFKMDTIDMGGVSLKKHELLVINFDDFPLSGGGRYPLVIAGIDTFQDRDFVLDFRNNRILLAPK